MTSNYKRPAVNQTSDDDDAKMREQAQRVIETTSKYYFDKFDLDMGHATPSGELPHVLPPPPSRQVAPPPAQTIASPKREGVVDHKVQDLDMSPD